MSKDPEIIVRPVEHWPRPLKTVRKVAPFKTNFEATIRKLRYELGRLEAGLVVVQVGFADREISVTTGWPRADRRPSNPGVIVAADTKHGALKWLCDDCDKWTHNVHAIALTLERLRLADLYGVTSRGEQYAGWKMLPGPITAGVAASRGWSVEEAARWVAAQYGQSQRTGKLHRTGMTGAEILRSAEVWRMVYRELAKSLHPDAAGGSPQVWADLQDAAKLLNSLHNRKG